jgi:O-antigen/teichoic acid export membrane protein
MNIKKILYFSLGPLGSALLGLISVPMIAWFFSTESVGQFSIFQVFINFSLLIVTFGLDQSYVRFFHEEKNKSQLLSDTLGPSLVILSFFLLTLYFLSIVLDFSISYTLFEIDSVYLTFIMISTLLLSVGVRFFSLILRMKELGLEFSISQVLPKFMFLVMMLLVVFFNFEPTYKILTSLYLTSIFFVFILFAWFTRYELKESLLNRVSFIEVKSLLRYSLPLMISGVAFWGLTSMDRIFLKIFSNFDELALYSVSISFAGIGMILQAVFSTVWAPVVYRWISVNEHPRKIKRVMDVMTILVLTLWATTACFSWMTDYLLPSKYASVKFILVSAMAAPFLYTLTEITSIGINISKKTIYSLYSTLIALVVNFIGNWYLISDYGAIGASISSAISFLVFFLVKTYFSFKLYYNFNYIKGVCFVCIFTILSLFPLISNNVLILFAYAPLLLIVFMFYKRDLIVYTRFLVKKWSHIKLS